MNCDKRNKCTVENRFVKPCFNLEETLGDWHQIGLSIFTLTSRETTLRRSKLKGLRICKRCI